MPATRRARSGTRTSVLGLPDVHGVEQRVAPELARRHGDQVLGMDRRDDALPTAILTAIEALDARASPALDQQPTYRLASEHDGVVRFQIATQGDAQHAGSSPGDRAA